MRHLQRRNWIRAFQLIGTIVLSWALLRTIDWIDIWNLISHLELGYIGLGVGFVQISHLVNVCRWQFILREESPGFGFLLGAYGAGLFSNNFLPTGIGGDGVRVVLLSRRLALSHSVLSVGFDRTIGFIALSGLFFLGRLLGAPPAVENQIIFKTFDLNIDIPHGILIMIGGMGLIGLVFGIFIKVSKFRLSTLRHRLFDSVISHRASYWARLLIGGYAFSFLSHLSLVSANWAILMALDIPSRAEVSIWLVLAGSLTLLIPIAVNGLGLQESVYVILLAGYGIPTATAFSVALIVRALMILSSLFGGIIVLFEGNSGATKAVI